MPLSPTEREALREQLVKEYEALDRRVDELERQLEALSREHPGEELSDAAPRVEP